MLKGSLVGCEELFRLGFGLGEMGLKGERALNSSVFVETEARAPEKALYVQDRGIRGSFSLLKGL